jgi:hypothetical protein
MEKIDTLEGLLLPEVKDLWFGSWGQHLRRGFSDCWRRFSLSWGRGPG